jgi:hypothetical protein
MSRRNSREAKDARNLRVKADLARRSEARSSATDLLEEKLRSEVRKIANDYNAKLEESSREELLEQHFMRTKEGERLPLDRPLKQMTRQQLIEILTLTVEHEDRIIDKEKESWQK